MKLTTLDVNRVRLTETQTAAVEFAIYDTIRRLRMEAMHSPSPHTQLECLGFLEEVKEIFS